MAIDLNENSWSLEVVRGTDTGRRLPLARGVVLLGNALGGNPGLDLATLEGNSLRKMAARHAQIEVQNGSLSLRDLNSPGGTFVDRRRIPPGSDLPLKDGDLIQLGGVQLRVVRGNGVASPADAARSPDGAVLTLKSGVSCRTWDDVLTIAAQRWSELRDELMSGSLAASLISAGNVKYAPDALALGSPDDRLDAWIGRLPTSRPAKPELDIHPRTVVIRTVAGGGMTRKKVQISNVGYRLLKSSARIEPSSATWLRIASDFEGKTFSTVDQTELSFDAMIPETLSSAMTANIIVESNGGTATIAVRVEPSIAKEFEPIATEVSKEQTGKRFRERVAVYSLRSRVLVWTGVAVALRILVAIAVLLLPTSGALPSLFGPLVLFSILGAIAAIRFGAKGSELRDYPWLALGGGLLGAMASAVIVAIVRTVEAPLGSSTLIAVIAWGLIGAASAYGSSFLIPPKSATETKL